MAQFFMLQSFYKWLGYCATNDYICSFTKGNIHTPEFLLKFANALPVPPYIAQPIVACIAGCYIYKRYSRKEAMTYIKALLIANGYDALTVEFVSTGAEFLLDYLIKWYKARNEQKPEPAPVLPSPGKPPKRDRKELEEERKRNAEDMRKKRNEIPGPKAKSVLNAFQIAKDANLGDPETVQTTATPADTNRAAFQAN